MPSYFDFQYRFHPAGQGVFASGTVLAVAEREENKKSYPFKWVFDCGSTAPHHLRRIVERYRKCIINSHLDLLCISHFDKDHVSGLETLLKDLDVDTVVMPYWSPVERLIAGASAGFTNNEYFTLLGNPVSFVIGRARSIRRIVIVGGPSDFPPEGTIYDQPPIPTDQDRFEPSHEVTWDFRFEGRELPLMHALTEPTMALANQRGVAVEVFGSQTKAFATPDSAFACWEFLFHHKPIDPSFAGAIKRKVEDSIPSGGTITELLRDAGQRKVIRAIYTSLLPNGDSVNSTSLCVYSGPDLERLRDSWIDVPSSETVWELSDESYRFLFPPHPVSILYTGDANLRIRTNRHELFDFITRERWRRLAILQVPHHGSRNNWESGAAADFFHSYSVFCADEANLRLGHPHRDVLLDLLHHGPLLVNKSISWSWKGTAVFG